MLEKVISRFLEFHTWGISHYIEASSLMWVYAHGNPLCNYLLFIQLKYEWRFKFFFLISALPRYLIFLLPRHLS